MTHGLAVVLQTTAVIRDFHELLCGPSCSAEGSVPAMAEVKVPVPKKIQKMAAVYGVIDELDLVEA